MYCEYCTHARRLMDEETEVDLMKEDICAWVFQRRCHISLHQQQFVYHLTD